MYRIIGGDGQEYGPVSTEQIRQWILEHRADAETKACPEGTTDWKPLRLFPEFAPLFSTPTQPRPVAPVAPGPAAGASMPRTNPFAVAGFILGMISLVSCWCCYGLPFNVIGIVLSIIALSQISNQPQQYGGKGLAIAGIILSAVSIVFSIIMAAMFGLMSAGQHRFHMRW